MEKTEWLKELKLQGLKHAVNEMDFSGICYWMRDIVIGCFYRDTWGKLDFKGVQFGKILISTAIKKFDGYARTAKLKDCR